MAVSEKNEKLGAELDTHSDDNGVLANDNGPLVCPPCTTDKKLLWRIDCHVVPWLCIMYLLAFLGKLSIFIHIIRARN